MGTIGGRMQDATWRELVQRIVAESGGDAPAGVQEESASLDGREAEWDEKWLEELARSRKRTENAEATGRS